jgi:hypothetical protein
MKKIITIEELRQVGFKVYVNHISPFHTEIFLTDPQGRTTFGYALCNEQDQPNRKMGNRIALGRAIKNMKSGIFCNFSLDKSTQL